MLCSTSLLVKVILIAKSGEKQSNNTHITDEKVVVEVLTKIDDGFEKLHMRLRNSSNIVVGFFIGVYNWQSMAWLSPPSKLTVWSPPVVEYTQQFAYVLWLRNPIHMLCGQAGCWKKTFSTMRFFSHSVRMRSHCPLCPSWKVS